MHKALKRKDPKQRIERMRGLFSYVAARYLDNNMNLDGLWDISFKIDGVRMIRGNNGLVYSRRGTLQASHIQQLMPPEITDAELFAVDWSTSMSLKANTVQGHPSYFYSLQPLDPRLLVAEGIHVTYKYLDELMNWAIAGGYEGIVIRKVGTLAWIKVVPECFADVRITGFIEGTGQHKGLLASFTTNYGRVAGGALNHEQRRWVWENQSQFRHMIIEASYRERFKSGILRFAQFARFRGDKDTENIPCGK